MCPYDEEIHNIKDQIMDIYSPIDIILFGSCAKGRVHKGSDIDICVIMNTENKREVVREMLLNINYDIDLDIVIYTPDEWSQYKDNQSTFIGIVNKTGVSLFDGYHKE